MVLRAQVKDLVLCFSQAYRTLAQVKDIVLCFPQAYRTTLSPQKVLVEPQKKPHGLYSQEGSLQPLETPKAAALKRWAMSLCSLSRQFTQLISREFLAHRISSASSIGTGRELAQKTHKCNGNTQLGAAHPVLPQWYSKSSGKKQFPNMNLKYSWCKKEVPVRLVGSETISLILSALRFPTVVLA